MTATENTHQQMPSTSAVGLEPLCNDQAAPTVAGHGLLQLVNRHSGNLFSSPVSPQAVNRSSMQPLVKPASQSQALVLQGH